MRLKIINDFDIQKQARELGVSVWQTPSFLFFVMGIVIIIAMTAVYSISKYYDSPEILIMTESGVVISLFIVGNFIIRNIEIMAISNKVKSEFVSVASHQLKTPLSEVSWKLELLMAKYSQGLTEKQHEILDSVNKSNDKMKRLVNDLLDVARIEQSNFYLGSESVDLNKIVEEAAVDYRDLARAKGVEIEVSTDRFLPSFQGDQRKLELMVGNLVSNAVKYMNKKGKVRIVSNFNPSKKQVQVCVEDNGVGIPDSQQKKIFEKFFRSDNVVKYQTEGTGLGLYIAKNIADKSGGDLWFESKENVGSKFCFILPVK